jgi:predicted transcriptional regulator
MSNTKTAISLDDALFQKAEQVAQELSLSRSRLYSLAIEEFVERYENKRLLQQINEAVADSVDEEDQRFLEQIRRYQGRIINDEW